MNEKELRDLLANSLNDFNGGISSLVKEIVRNAVETTVSQYEPQINELRAEAEKNCVRYQKLEKELAEADEGQKFYKKKLEEEQSIPKLRTVLESILGIITLFYSVLPTLPKENAEYIKRTIQNSLSPYGKLIMRRPEASYDAKVDECIAQESAPNYLLEGKIKEVQCMGFEFERKFGLDIIKEKVVLYSETKRQSDVIENFDGSGYKLKYSLCCCFHGGRMNSTRDDQKCIGVANSSFSGMKVDFLSLGGGNIISIQAYDATNQKCIRDVIRYQVPGRIYSRKCLMSFELCKKGRYLLPRILLYDAYSKDLLDVVVGEEFSPTELFYSDYY